MIRIAMPRISVWVTLVSDAAGVAVSALSELV